MKQSGVYKILNKINNKCYIGSSSNILFRWSVHKYHLNYQKHINKKLQRAWNKYGKNAFIFTIVELCGTTKKELEDREQYYLDSLKPDYNILLKAYSGLGRPTSEKTRKKISKKLRGKKVSEETRKKMSLAKLGKPSPIKGRALTKEHKEKIAIAKKGEKHIKKGKLSKEQVFDIYRQIPFLDIREDILKLATSFNISEAYLRHIIKGDRCSIWYNEYHV